MEKKDHSSADCSEDMTAIIKVLFLCNALLFTILMLRITLTITLTRGQIIERAKMFSECSQNERNSLNFSQNLIPLKYMSNFIQFHSIRTQSNLIPLFSKTRNLVSEQIKQPSKDCCQHLNHMFSLDILIPKGALMNI